MAGAPSSPSGRTPAPRAPTGAQPVARPYTPLFHAQNDARYLRRDLIRDYQNKYSCRLAIMSDVIHPDGVTYFGELIHDTDPSKDLHLVLRSSGGDGLAAVRIVRAAQASCRRLVVVVPDIAKSAATILALGAHEIVMGPTSDLGPIDPQVLVVDRGYISAKEIIAAVEWALNDVAKRQSTHPLHAALLGSGNVEATIYQFAKSALAGTSQIARQAIGSNPDRTPPEVDDLVTSVERDLISGTTLHSAVVGTTEARGVGLPVTELDPGCEQWQDIWRLWTRYFTLGPLDMMMIYESEQASQIVSLDLNAQS